MDAGCDRDEQLPGFDLAAELLEHLRHDLRLDCQNDGVGLVYRLRAGLEAGDRKCFFQPAAGQGAGVADMDGLGRQARLAQSAD